MSLETAFTSIFSVIYDFAISLAQSLNNILLTSGIKSLDEITISLRIFSDNPIVELDLLTILVYFIIIVFSVIIYKLIKKIVLLPYNFWGVK